MPAVVPSSLKEYPVALFLIWLAGAVVLILWSILLCDGHLIYTLDDPYIHLRVAQNILHGGYGINFGEYASPCSSVIYPYILALTELVGFGVWGPLVINLLAMGSAVYVVGHIFRDYVFTSDGKDSDFIGSKLFPFILGILMCFVMNAWGLVMTGMEHSLHVLAVVLVIWGFLRILDGGTEFPEWLIPAIVALPFIRFEGLALSLFSLVALVYLGYRFRAFVAALLIVSGLFSWFLFTHSHGLPVLPSSVLLKSDIAANAVEGTGWAQLLNAIYGNVKKPLIYPQAILFIISLFIVFALSYKACQEGRRQIAIVIGGMTIFTAISHIFFGRYGWFSRYEIYAITLNMISALILGRFYLFQKNVKERVLWAFLVVATTYIMTTLLTPTGARNIYQQQYQMHRFAVEYWRQPVAVNDLGLVSYDNPDYVLDLYGLDSEEVRRMRMTYGRYDEKALSMLVERNNVSLIMVYEELFKPIIPDDWHKIAVLNTSCVTASSDQVSFYITPKADRTEALEMLHQFAKTLPKGAVLKIL
jgi:hypothetical protein